MAKFWFYSLFVFVLLALASFSAYAQDDEDYLPYTHYNDNFIEGKTLTIDMRVLDKVVFTYYGENYTFSVMGLGAETSTVRVERRAFEVILGGKIFFDFDDENDEDISVSFVDSDGDEGTYKLELFKKVWDVPEPDPEPEPEPEAEPDPEPEPDPEDETPPEDDEPPQAQEQAAEDDAPEDESGESTTGRTVVNISINFTFGEGSLVGILVIAIVVSAGLIAYRKIRNRAKKRSEYEMLPAKKKKRSKIRR